MAAILVKVTAVDRCSSWMPKENLRSLVSLVGVTVAVSRTDQEFTPRWQAMWIGLRRRWPLPSTRRASRWDYLAKETPMKVQDLTGKSRRATWLVLAAVALIVAASKLELQHVSAQGLGPRLLCPTPPDHRPWI